MNNPISSLNDGDKFYHRSYDAERIKKKKAMGICRQCSEPAEKGTTRCKKCREYAKQWMRDKRKMEKKK